MSQRDELKRAAELVNKTYADLCEQGGDQLAEAWNSAELAYDDAANPDVVLALLAENEAYASRLHEVATICVTAEQERDHLKAEIAGLRTGYQAYEQVNAELKAENDRLRSDIETWKLSIQAERNCHRAEKEGLQQELDRLKGPAFAEDLAALRKDADRYRWLQHGHSGHIEVVEWIGPHAAGMIGDDLDALVDAAMSKAVQG